MNRFWNILMQPIIERVNAKYIVEIGSDTGLNTRNILDYCVEHDAHMTAIDPVPKFDIDEFKAEYGDRFEIYKELSLNRLPLLEDYDVILIDGDHNWYTVYNELKIIEKQFKYEKFPLIFLHDVGWPYGRRDLYYSPETIPEKYRQPYKQLGMYPDQTELKEEGGLNYMLNNALYENNSHNGVLTAIEDFIDESASEFSFISVPAYFGLGILFPKNHEMEKKIKGMINELNLLKKHEKQVLQLIIQRSELNNHIKKVHSQLIEKTNELKETHNRLQLTKKQFNDLASEMRKTQDDVQKLKSETDNLNNRIIETQYRNQKRPINQKLISWFPSLYMLLKINQTGLKNGLLNIKGHHALKKDKLFNIGYYLKNSTDVKLKGKDPILHYIYHGFKEGRNPYPEFNTNYYIKTYQDVEQSKINPLIHYVLYGKKEKRQTHKTSEEYKAISNPKISIITASYNYAHRIQKAIKSIVDQTYENWELIIVDDGSTDNSLEVIEKYTKNSKIKLYQHEGGVNKGLKETLLLGLRYSTGKYIAFLEADDWLEDNYLEEKVKILEKHSNLKFIFNDINLHSNKENVSWYQGYLKAQKEILRNKNMPCKCSDFFNKHNFIPTFSCVLVEKDILLSCNFDTPQDPTLDYWIFKQLASKTDFYYIDKKLSNWLIHEDSYINEIFSPTEDFDGFLSEYSNMLTTMKNDFVDTFYKKNPNVNSDRYVPKSNRHFQRQNDDVKLIAFYLPQFHTIDENDEWWGKGFTEWTNVTKAQPQFLGHYQPRLPDELGFYNLAYDDTFHKQIELAKKYGIYGFCFHYYWFSGKRLLEKPLLNFLNNKDLNFPFMLCWANESWSRAWTTLEGEILIEQKFEEKDYLEFIKDIMPFFKDERYIKINNKPVLIVYRPNFFSKEQLVDAIKVWRNYAKKQGFDDLYILNTRTGGFKDDPFTWGLDGTVEFPPNDIVRVPLEKKLRVLNPNFNGHVFDLPKCIESTLALPSTDYVLYKTVFPEWDNTPRRSDRPSMYVGSSPEMYKKWLSHCIKYTQKKFDEDNRFVFINAWNEWAEGAYLEPDRKYGFAYLEATLDILKDYQLKK